MTVKAMSEADQDKARGRYLSGESTAAIAADYKLDPIGLFVNLIQPKNARSSR